MGFLQLARIGLAVAVTAALSGCGGGGWWGSPGAQAVQAANEATPDAGAIGASGSQVAEFEAAAGRPPERGDAETPVQSLFFTNANPNTTIEVNKYLWQASLEILNFLPIQSVDPFSGIIVTGFGTPPGGGGSYRATIYVQDPALDARSLKVAIVGRGGPVSADTERAVEDAILTRARQLRVRDSNL